MITPVSASTSAPAATGVGRRRAFVVVGATLAPAAAWLLAQATGTELAVTLAGRPPMVLSLPFVIGTALAAALAGWAALALLQRMTRHARTLWTGLAIAALLASFAPVAIVQTNTAARSMLALMHVIVASVLILGLRRTVPARRATQTGRSHS
jgi:peptidoglycan/LPS O-acetylase OafA/YrhL